MKFEAFDAIYLEKLRSGDRLTEEHFVQYFSVLIQLKLRRRLSSPSEIDDVRQETFIRVWAALRSDQGISQPQRLGSFVNSICNHVLFEHYRRVAKELPTGIDFEITIPDPRPSGLETISDREMKQKVHDVLSKLSARDRLLLEQVFLDECDKEEVCRDFGVNRDYLRVLLHRSIKSLKKSFVEETQALGKVCCAGPPSTGISVMPQLDVVLKSQHRVA